ncbi:hypothetical protein PVT67_14140 [Gallaecimonas kandeliae]|uniref:hypothetical protein n=1 Tax=Gallaecimonas kandeliae TaxID=3029055 RepID=UPI002647ABF0|nr:hypothetical protein [Gallaecimonas kandeliae]WKE64794.1 hypothetical protein PVT67_14140 [Gallaecimonas kandeliae]
MPEKMMRSSVATVQLGVARADGKLSLTDSDVSFVPFNEQFGLGPYRFKRDEIKSVAKCLGKGGGIMPVTTDAIRVTLSDESCYEFIVAEAEQWIEALGEIIS